MTSLFVYPVPELVEGEFIEGFLVTRLGLEPKTPTLKVLCSTN